MSATLSAPRWPLENPAYTVEAPKTKYSGKLSRAARNLNRGKVGYGTLEDAEVAALDWIQKHPDQFYLYVVADDKYVVRIVDVNGTVS